MNICETIKKYIYKVRYAHEFNESHWIRRQGLEMRSPPAEQNSDDGLDDHYNVFLLYDEDIAADRSFAMEIFDNLVERGLKVPIFPHLF